MEKCFSRNLSLISQAKTEKVNKIAMKSFLNLLFKIDVKLSFIDEMNIKNLNTWFIHTARLRLNA